MARPPLNALRVFSVVAKHGSFAAAAGVLHVTAAAVSGQVRGLEAYLDLKLFTRNARGVQLTDEGAALRAQVESGLDEVERAVDALRARRRDGRD